MSGKWKAVVAKVMIAVAMLMLFVHLSDGDMTEAAKVNEKTVYTVSKLKKALKAKSAATITFRTETVDDITIPAVKAAKNKKLYIYAPNAKVTNKAKLKEIHVKKTKEYYENANKNIIYVYNYNMTGIVVMPKKTVSKMIFMNYEYGRPEVVIRKGAKIGEVEFESFGTVSTKNAETGSVNIVTKNYYVPGYPTVTTTFDLDKSGRIISMDVDDSYAGGGQMYSFKYDSNGNMTEEACIGDGEEDTTSYRYDKNNNLTQIKSVDRLGTVQYIYEYKFDSAGRMIESYEVDSYGNKNYYYTKKYDKNGRLVEEGSDRTDTRNLYTYDKSGRRITAKAINRYDDSVINEVTYAYDENGLLKNAVYDMVTQGKLRTEYYLYDNKGELVYTAAAADDDIINSIYYSVPDYDYKYEDGFVSPVIGGDFDSLKKRYEKSGYTVVSSVTELFQSIKPGAKIILKPGIYNLSEEIGKALLNKSFRELSASFRYIDIEDVPDGYQVVIKDVDGLTISGGSNYCSHTEIVCDPRYATVLGFKNCKNVTLNSLTIGHTEMGDCMGDVIGLNNCSDTKLYNTDLYGCGVYGINISGGSEDLKVFNSIIHDCSEGPLDIGTCSGVLEFICCSFTGSEGGGAYSRYDCDASIKLDRCSIGGKETNKWFFLKELDSVTFKDCYFSEVTQYPDYGM